MNNELLLMKNRTSYCNPKEYPGLTQFMIMRLSGVDRDVAIGVLAFYLGKKEAKQFDSEYIAVATDTFIGNCLDNPLGKALKSMDSILAGQE